MTRSYAVAIVFLEVRVVSGIFGFDDSASAGETIVWMCLAFSLLFADLVIHLAGFGAGTSGGRPRAGPLTATSRFSFMLRRKAPSIIHRGFGPMNKLGALSLLFPLLFGGVPAQAQHDTVLPTWLHRDLATLQEHRTDFSSATCHYRAIFGEGDIETRLPVSIARFGEATIDPHGQCQTVTYRRQEELYFVRDGKGALHFGGETLALKQNDFTYLAPAVAHSVSNPSDTPLHLIVATVVIPNTVSLHSPGKPQVANLSELQEQTVQGHPQSVLYKLLIGPRAGMRDRINAAYRVADFFLMDFAPAGTNFPHHHEIAEEVYLVLDGEGQIAAGGGMDGVEGLHPAKPGDAYYFRPYCTVGFYNRDVPNAKAHILALRVLVPMPATD